MKKILLLLVLTAQIFVAAGQSRKEKNIQDLFEKAQEQIDDSLYSDAINTYNEIMKMAPANSTSYGKAFYNTGYTYLLLNNNEDARKIFSEILQSDFDEMDKGGRGSGLMGEPYALYKHNSCENLAQIELNTGNYEAALEYIEMFDKKYPYRHFCGNEIAGFEIYKSVMYAKAYCGMMDTVKAIEALLPHVFDNGLASNTQALREVLILLKAKYSKDFLATELKKSVANISSKTIKQGKYKYTVYQIDFLGVKIEIPEQYFVTKSTSKNADTLEIEKRRLVILASEFYEKITS